MLSSFYILLSKLVNLPHAVFGVKVLKSTKLQIFIFHFAANVLYIFGTFGTIDTNETFEDTLEQLKAD